MVNAVNHVTLGGRIVSDVELRQTNKKKIDVCDFRVVNSNRRLPNRLFIDVEVWGKEARRTAEKTRRGDYVVLVGELRRDVWEAKENGEKRSKIKVTANRVILSSDKKELDDSGTVSEGGSQFSF